MPCWVYIETMRRTNRSGSLHAAVSLSSSLVSYSFDCFQCPQHTSWSACENRLIRSSSCCRSASSFDVSTLPTPMVESAGLGWGSTCWLAVWLVVRSGGHPRVSDSIVDVTFPVRKSAGRRVLQMWDRQLWRIGHFDCYETSVATNMAIDFVEQLD